MTKPAVRIAVSSAAGDPRLEKTWSGTPFNLITALEEQGVEVLAINSSLSSATPGVLQIGASPCRVHGPHRPRPRGSAYRGPPC